MRGAPVGPSAPRACDGGMKGRHLAHRLRYGRGDRGAAPSAVDRAASASHAGAREWPPGPGGEA
ncbi:hypothetical protein GCM10009416_47730 [Craurococcus roseus]|uniref:Uncharacterized protein n=1 Tax=Craurococcus roseus TaxID=77585 RepID=A0ABN1G5R0_9PROT